MSVDNHVPEIRFAGFSGEWEERELESIYNKIRNAFVGTATPFYVDKGHFYLESNNVKNGQINKKNQIFINDEFYKKQSDKWLRTGDIVMVQSGHVGHTAVIPPELNNIAAHALIMFTEPKGKTYPYFFNYQFQTANSKTKLSEITTGNTIKHILSSEMKEFYVFKPIYQEQTKIGSYFQQLDSLIAQHQQKHDKLLNIKKALLEKMFPKQGEAVPDIRFKGFSDKWEERKLGDIGSVAMNKRIFKQQTSDEGDIPFFKIGTFGSKPDAFISRELFDKYKSKYPFPEEGDLLISASGSIGRMVEYTGDDQYFQDSNIVWLKHDGKVENSFLKVFYSIVKWSGLEGSTIKRLYNKNILETHISVPALEEQTKIGNLFKHLDTLLSHHQAQLKKLNNIKQACLAKMFV